MTRYFVFLFLMTFVLPGYGAEDQDTAVQTLTPEEVENYQFPVPEDNSVVRDLNLGQMTVLNRMRRQGKELLSRQLGIVRFNAREEDLASLQQFVTRRVLPQQDVENWQAVGVLFGDILVNELHLHWISYEDEYGVSKALQYRDTKNYVFPITVFSKRNRFNEDIDMREIYESIKTQVEVFKKDALRPRMPQ